MSASQTVYACSIVRRLRKEIEADPDKVLILSPYLTSKTAETVILAANPDNSEVYTMFSPEVFAIGASSIGTVRKLLENSFQIYHLPGLHAKSVITGTFASVGSQNLTQGGTRRREVTLVTIDTAQIEHFRSQIKEWFEDRREITLDMVGDMEAILPDLKRKYRLFQETLEVAKHEIAVREISRETERKRREQIKQRKKIAQQQKREARRQSSLRVRTDSIRTAIKSKEVIASEAIHTQLVTKRNHNQYGDYTGSYATLQRLRADSSLLEWKIGAPGKSIEFHRLDNRYRYLMLFLSNGRLAWPALNKTQISQFGNGLNVISPFEVRGHSCNLEINFASSLTDLLTWNIEAIVRPTSPQNGNPLPGIIVRGYFSVQQFKVVSTSIEADADSSTPQIEQLVFDINSPDSELVKCILEQLLTDFKYEKNRFGIGADEFFHGWGYYFRLRLNKFRNYLFLTAEEAYT